MFTAQGHREKIREVRAFSHHKEYAKKISNGIKREIAGDQHLFQEGLPELVQDIQKIKE